MTLHPDINRDEYIHHLTRNNDALETENRKLRAALLDYAHTINKATETAMQALRIDGPGVNVTHGVSTYEQWWEGIPADECETVKEGGDA